MKKDENLEAQESTVEEAAEAEVVEEVIIEEAAEAEEAEAAEEEVELPNEKVKAVMKKAADRIKELEQQSQDNLDKYQRCLAEFDNFRKRTVKEKAGMYDDGVRSTVEKLLMVIDNLERAVAVQEGKADENDAFFKGVKMTLTQFQDVLKSIGVEEIKAVGEKFDPNLHAAVAHEDDENYGENEVVLEMLKGYMYKDKVIRHSMVKVAN
ncbi:MAG: nucleotide exchange factor GrpE [Bacillota bacterium]|nr:nucleotide exchange factor GrpE [Bacillota bacterium]